MTAPANDTLLNAQLVNPGASVFGPFAIDDATLDSGESGMDQTVWYKFYAGESTTVTVSTWGSSAGDADSGDLEPAGGPFGYLDTRLAAYYKSDGTPATAFAQLTGAGFNEDHPDTGEPHTGDGFWWSYLTFTTVAGRWYYVQAGTYDTPYTGTMRVEFTEVSRPPFNVVDVGECPADVVYSDIGAGSTRTTPHSGDAGTFTDSVMSWYEPPHNAGDLLVFVLISSMGGESLPAGYTLVDTQTWDNAPITPPVHGTFSTTDGPAYRQQVYQIVGYRIATSGGGSDVTPAGTYSGYTYTDGGLGYPNDAAAVRVYAFTLEQMGGDYPDLPASAWPANPVKAGLMNSVDYEMELGPDGDGNGDGINDGDGATGGFYPAVDSPGPHSVAVSDVTADHDGNHIWLTLVSVHGPILAESTTFPTGSQENSMSLRPRQFRTTGTPGLDTYGVIGASTGPGGPPGNNDHYAVGYLSATSYFTPFRPDSWGGNENGFVDTTPDPGASVLGHVGTDWADGFIGVAGSVTGDHYVWCLTGGVAMQQFVIQGPETTRPPNDNLADAYTVPECPVTIVECVFGQTAESGETYDGLGDSENASVWFKYVPGTTETGVIIATDVESSDPSLGAFPAYFSEYDTILVVYDSTMTVIASDDDGGVGSLSRLTIDVTAGETYYIQVVGYGGEEGRLLLTIDCTGGVLTTAADIWGWGGDTGEGWHVTLGTDA